ncbi:ArsR/SmtB family transcription factor [Acaryochloris marina]|uniref:Transcriptional regulator, ArsR family n=1 Tax=Acaryochloris marina (strain MBIC 11017) TaxID=329726 RepID=A8ZL41_ACAM1|nr:winged helix-turn-helix domain-containing protein [Acaryochloris marina]ABW31509.1 transcriptional regulator, ArsR family [Acaryochloris marina MBIC11017]
MKQVEALKAISALSQETRLDIIRYLVQCGEAGAAAGEIGKAVEVTSSRMSFHLSKLENAGLVSSERQSRHIVYKADFACLGGLISFLLNDCCDNHPDIASCCLPGKNCC